MQNHLTWVGKQSQTGTFSTADSSRMLAGLSGFFWRLMHPKKTLHTSFHITPTSNQCRSLEKGGTHENKSENQKLRLLGGKLESKQASIQTTVIQGLCCCCPRPHADEIQAEPPHICQDSHSIMWISLTRLHATMKEEKLSGWSWDGKNSIFQRHFSSL